MREARRTVGPLCKRQRTHPHSLAREGACGIAGITVSQSGKENVFLADRMVSSQALDSAAGSQGPVRARVVCAVEVAANEQRASANGVCASLVRPCESREWLGVRVGGVSRAGSAGRRRMCERGLSAGCSCPQDNGARRCILWRCWGMVARASQVRGSQGATPPLDASRARLSSGAARSGAPEAE